MTPPCKHIPLLRHESHRRERERLPELVARDFGEDLVADLATAAEVRDVQVGGDAGAEEATGGDC